MHRQAPFALPTGWTQRFGPSGIHLFERRSGLNVLLDEVAVPRRSWSLAPRQVSIALTNRCDLACGHCYAPKSGDELKFEDITRWMAELDATGCLGIGFGGGEPTLYPRFAELCEHVARHTSMAVTFTTHGHLIDRDMAEKLRNHVHFIRVSMDGVGDTYEAIRRRSFTALKRQIQIIGSIAPFGLNFVVNERTLPDLDRAAKTAADFGATELLLLPQMSTSKAEGICDEALGNLRDWVDTYEGETRLSIGDSSAAGFPTCDPLPEERGLRAYAHIDSKGILKARSYDSSGVRISRSGVIDAVGRFSGDGVREG